MVEVKVVIKPDGSVTYEVEGARGATCVEETEFIDQLGEIEKRDFKPEYYETEEHINVRTDMG